LFSLHPDSWLACNFEDDNGIKLSQEGVVFFLRHKMLLLRESSDQTVQPKKGLRLIFVDGAPFDDKASLAQHLRERLSSATSDHDYWLTKLEFEDNFPEHDFPEHKREETPCCEVCCGVTLAAIVSGVCACFIVPNALFKCSSEGDCRGGCNDVGVGAFGCLDRVLCCIPRHFADPCGCLDETGKITNLGEFACFSSDSNCSDNNCSDVVCAIPECICSVLMCCFDDDDDD
jgi:hypothetical protein